MNNVTIGLRAPERALIVKKLGQLLASNYTLYLKTHNFHWNVTGPMFQPLHALFETQYIDLWNANDLIAERIRALGHFVAASYTDFKDLTLIRDVQGSFPLPAEQMMAQLRADHEQMTCFIREAPLPPAEQANDQVTIDLLTSRMKFHEEQAWMLRSFLGK